MLFPFSISRCSLWFLATNLSSFLDSSLRKLAPCLCLICFLLLTICLPNLLGLPWWWSSLWHVLIWGLGFMNLHNSYKVVGKMSSFFSFFFFCLFLPFKTLKIHVYYDLAYSAHLKIVCSWWFICIFILLLWPSFYSVIPNVLLTLILFLFYFQSTYYNFDL